MAAIANDSGLNDAKAGLKRLSLTPGASLVARSSSSASTSPIPSPSPSTPAQTSSPLGHGKRHAAKRMSSISYYNSSNTVPSPTSSSSGSFLRSPTIAEEPGFSLQRAASLPRKPRPRTSIDTQHKRQYSTYATGEPSAATVPAVQTLAEK